VDVILAGARDEPAVVSEGNSKWLYRVNPA